MSRSAPTVRAMRSEPGHADAVLNAETSAARALEWLQCGVSNLTTRSGRSGWSAEAEFRRLKAICELSFIFAILPGEEPKQYLELIAPHLCEAARGGRFLAALWHQPQHANLYLPLLYALGVSGNLTLAEKSDIAVLLQRIVRMRKERLPFRSLDFLYSFYLLTGNPEFRERMIPATEEGCLGATADLVTFVDGDEYALTHSIFYLSGFGSWRWPLGENSKSKALSLLDVLALDSACSEDWDLYAEYRCAEVMLEPESKLIEEAPLLAAQRNDGSWSGPTNLSSVLQRDGFTGAESLHFYQNYHTTLVAWLALTLPRLRPSPQTLTLLQEQASWHAPFEESGTAERYPPLSTSWLKLVDAFESLVNGGNPIAPDESLAEEAQGILPWLEWWYWRQHIDPVTDSPVPSGTALHEAAIDAADTGSWRSLRCALLGSVGSSEATGFFEHIVARLWQQLSCASPHLMLTTPGIDCLVALALLESGNIQLPFEIRSEFAVMLSRAVTLALRRHDVFSLAPLLAFAGHYLDPNVRAQATRLLREGTSKTLPYGFIAADSSIEIQRRCLTTECYLAQIALANMQSSTKR